MSYKKLHLNIIVLILSIVLPQCKQAGSDKSDKVIFKKDLIMEIPSSDTLCLTWDKPEDSTVSKYRIFYRLHNNINWILLEKAIPLSDSPTVCIHRNEISTKDHLFDFAVRAYFTSGDSSDLSISTDSTKTSHDGWFVKW